MREETGKIGMEDKLVEYIYKAGAIDVDKAPKVLGAANPAMYELLKIKAAEMRCKPTEAEKVLWGNVCKKKLGVKFRQQHIIDRFIVDFYCIEKRLAIEVDGTVHDKQKERDSERDGLLNSYGVNILRFTNEAVLYRLDAVLNTINGVLKSPLGDLGASFPAFAFLSPERV